MTKSRIPIPAEFKHPMPAEARRSTGVRFRLVATLSTKALAERYFSGQTDDLHRPGNSEGFLVATG
jgi:hypothetical protein